VAFVCTYQLVDSLRFRGAIDLSLEKHIEVMCEYLGE